MTPSLFSGIPMPSHPLPMRALTWKEPYASLMLYGKVETRKWNTAYRGLVLICSGLVRYSSVERLEIAGEDQYRRISEIVIGHKLEPWPYVGHAFAVGHLVHTAPMRPEDEDKCFVQYKPGLICHYYESVRPIKPIPFKGKQGWTIFTEETKPTVEFL